MTDATSALFAPWSNFCILAGTSAATLTGLMFVVITLVSNTDGRTTSMGISTFSTPTVLHFCAALLIAALLIIPWPSLLAAAFAEATIGIYSLGHVTIATWRARHMREYRPDLEDWIFYSLLPIVAYGAITAGAIVLPLFARNALYILAAGIVLLIVIGIRNAWDIVTYIVVGRADGAVTASIETDSGATGIPLVPGRDGNTETS